MQAVEPDFPPGNERFQDLPTDFPSGRNLTGRLQNLTLESGAGSSSS
jgi:hypothetical protein